MIGVYAFVIILAIAFFAYKIIKATNIDTEEQRIHAEEERKKKLPLDAAEEGLDNATRDVTVAKLQKRTEKLNEKAREIRK